MSFFDRDVIPLRKWDDPLVDEHGVDVTAVACEVAWLPALGPSAVVVLRRFGMWLAVDPDPVVDMDALGRAIGVTKRPRLTHTMERLERFKVVAATGSGVLLVRTRLAAPPVRFRCPRTVVA